MSAPEKTAGAAGDARLLKVGIIGTIVAALCCFTPILVILLATVGLSAVLGWIDYVLLPALVIFAGITLYALWRRKQRQGTIE